MKTLGLTPTNQVKNALIKLLETEEKKKHKKIENGKKIFHALG